MDPFLSRDYQNLQPVGGWALPETSCNQAQTCTTASSMEEYESELGVQVAVSGGYEGGVSSAAFSASVESESFQSDVVEKNSERYVQNMHCSRYTVHGSRFTVHGSRFTVHGSCADHMYGVATLCGEGGLCQCALL